MAVRPADLEQKYPEAMISLGGNIQLYQQLAQISTVINGDCLASQLQRLFGQAKNQGGQYERQYEAGPA
ncbi:hypothetical protein P0D90_33565 [Pseudomonas sp. CBSPCBW29]|nr:hypothetical protein P0D90_33565 [Pseudomonas sp. CBSPCBW29]